MFRTLKTSRIAWLAMGLVGGLILTGMWPESPLHAVATDRCQTYAMATGPLDEDVEAVFFLDFLTGELKGAALNKQLGKFTAYFAARPIDDIGADPSKNPSYMMTTGMANLRRGGSRMQPSLSVVYVAEVTTGKVAAYSIPWNPAAHNMGRPINQAMLLLDVTLFRPAAAGTVVPSP
ncbi:MAG: hypothetical protein A2V70_07680 [Planctomycetes bacterium RBG_13_63_9]|nr:MAG: hypothetical protein A2V70_07680 [Planctomycetes bacterium RBG_13_63_9]